MSDKFKCFNGNEKIAFDSKLFNELTLKKYLENLIKFIPIKKKSFGHSKKKKQS